MNGQDSLATTLHGSADADVEAGQRALLRVFDRALLVLAQSGVAHIVCVGCIR